jgi:hypothetical protein
MLWLVPITTLYVMLGICGALLIGVSVAMYRRVRRLSRASDTQFRRAVEAEESAESAMVPEAQHARAARENG